MMFSLNCANCAAPLQIKPEVKDFVCAYCGSAQIVDRSGGTITLKLVADTLGRVERGTDRTASELALVRLKRERKYLGGDFVLIGKPGTDDPLSARPPTKPKSMRPGSKTGFFHWLKRAFTDKRLNEIDDLMLYYDKLDWDTYDKDMATYNQCVVDWPTLHKEQLRANDECEKRRRELDAEIAFHEAIVKR